ncbi:MAG: glycosyltransferase [Pyrinomonadaceae bacterium]
MRLVVFGLTISSAWANGHATLLRGLFQAFHELGHTTLFFERDVPYYAAHRDLTDLEGVELRLYDDWPTIAAEARASLLEAEVAMVTSYCPDAVAASSLIFDSNIPVRVFYDLDTPVTLDSLRRGSSVSYIGPRGLCDFDLVLSYTGGVALEELQTRLGARTVAPLYGSVDPKIHKRVGQRSGAAIADLSYLGTYAKDRQPQLEELFLKPAAKLPDRRFLIGGSKYPEEFPWTANIWYIDHVPPHQHSAFYSSSAITLNITRAAMASTGYCPSGRLFEAAACGAAIISDYWEGLEEFFEPGRDIIVARTCDDVVAALSFSPETLRNIGRSGQERTLETSTALHRAHQLESLLADQLMSRNIEPAICIGSHAAALEV